MADQVVSKVKEWSDYAHSLLDEEVVGRAAATRNKWIAAAAGIGAAYCLLRLVTRSQREYLQSRRVAKRLQPVTVKLTAANIAYLEENMARYGMDMSAAVQSVLDYATQECGTPAQAYETANAADATLAPSDGEVTLRLDRSHVHWLAGVTSAQLAADESAALNMLLAIIAKVAHRLVFGIDRSASRTGSNSVPFTLKS